MVRALATLGLVSLAVACGTEVASICGDRAITGAEECDDGNARGGDGCTAACLIETAEREVCGNAVLDSGEDCDDGNATDGDGCDAACVSEQPIACGNGLHEREEGCDDGNTEAGDGCDPSCAVEQPTGLCTPTLGLGCDSFDTGDTSGAGATRDVSSYSCVSWNTSGPERAYVFVAPADLEVDVQLHSDAELDVYVIEGGGECQPDACMTHGDASATFTARAGQSYYIVVDGYLGDAGRYWLHLACESRCGDGQIGRGEQCDDGNQVDGDGCSAECREEPPPPPPPEPTPSSVRER